jgi:DNA-directed RNA polymerase subunit M/transcription elongation factor TFIIS
MRDGKCPKCSSTEIYYAQTKGLSANTSHILALHTFTTSGRAKVELFNLENYVCRTCGYLETYVTTDENLARLDYSTTWKKL